jgi:hypothetical protein
MCTGSFCDRAERKGLIVECLDLLSLADERRGKVAK